MTDVNLNLLLFNSSESIYLLLNSLDHDIHKDIHQVANQLQDSMEKLQEEQQKSYKLSN